MSSGPEQGHWTAGKIFTLETLPQTTHEYKPVFRTPKKADSKCLSCFHLLFRNPFLGLFYFGAIPGGVQEPFQAVPGPYTVGIELKMATCKASALTTVLSLWLLENSIFLFFPSMLAQRYP